MTEPDGSDDFCQTNEKEMKHSSINFRSISVQPAWLLSSLWTGFHGDATPVQSLATLSSGTESMNEAGKQKKKERQKKS